MPVLVKLNVSPETSPPKVMAAVPPTLRMREPVRVIAPTLWSRLPVPVKFRSAARVTGLVMEAPPAKASSVPPLTVNVPAVPPAPPSAKVEEPRMSVPASRFVAPE